MSFMIFAINIRMFNLRRMIWLGHVAHMRQEKCMHSLGEKTSRHRWGIIYWILRKRVGGCRLAQDRNQWLARVNIVMNLQDP
jgi:hypothetical protein